MLIAEEEESGPLRICAICDGFDALVRMSAWLVHLPASAIRTDLGMVEALEHLHQPPDQDYDQIIIAPDTGKGTAPKMVTGVVQAAMARSGDIVVLLPPGARLQLPPLRGVQIRYGPPFNPPPPISAPGQIASAAADLPVSNESPEQAKTRNGNLLTRLLRPRSTPGPEPITRPPELPQHPCRLLALQPVSGGSGATTIAVNLAMELAKRPDAPDICLLDLNLQFGNAGTYLDLPANTRVTDAYRQLATLDYDSFQSCLTRVTDHLRIFTVPAEILPVDGISERDLRRILGLARDSADLVILDLPHLVSDWSGTAWAEADQIFTISRADVRSAQNMLRLMALIRAERLAEGRIFHLLNQVPPRPDAAWSAARAGFESGLGCAFFRQLPDGGDAVTAACNSGAALSGAAPGNPFRSGILALAEILGPKLTRRRLTETGSS